MTAILTNPRERTRFFRFAVVGVIGAVVDFGVMNLLSSLFPVPVKIGNQVISPLVWAGTISFIAAILSNFTWNRYWTYPDSRSKPILRQLLVFTFISVMGLAIRIPILKFLEPVVVSVLESLPLPSKIFTPEFLGKNITLAVAVIVVMFWNFFVNRYWTYNDVV
ncbi:MAG: putative rane protein [Acidobacteria bacterium]|nr:putative rane protein [Acidobacteriota bacterium]